MPKSSNALLEEEVILIKYSESSGASIINFVVRYTVPGTPEELYFLHPFRSGNGLAGRCIFYLGIRIVKTLRIDGIFRDKLLERSLGYPDRTAADLDADQSALPDERVDMLLRTAQRLSYGLDGDVAVFGVIHS